MKYDLLNDDLLLNPRRSEDSRVVLSSWIGQEDAYDIVMPSKDAPADVKAQFYALTAERIFFRTKVLGLEDADVAIKHCAEIKNARPFGEGTPQLKELLEDKVNAIMAYVPLASLVSGGTSILARLYCVTGLETEYPLPFEGKGIANGWNFNWFLGGVDVNNGHKPSGNSWHLAASVLVFAIKEQRANQDVRRKLATTYIFTGTVEKNRRVGKVDQIPEKALLAKMPEYEELIWIVPKGNFQEVKHLRAKAVGNLDDAYEYLLGWGPETAILLSCVNKGTQRKSLKAIYASLKSGGDANAPDENGRNTRQKIMSNIQRKIVNMIKSARDGDARFKDKSEVDLQNIVRNELAPEWDAEKASSYYGNDPLLFFLAAKEGDLKFIKHLKAKMNIDAVDRDGETALDFAYEVGDKDVIELLRRAGAKYRGIYAPGSKRMRAFYRDPETEYALDDGAFIRDALKAGLDPLASVNFGSTENGGAIMRERIVWDNEADDSDPWNKKPITKISYSHSTLLKEAVYIKNLPLVKACLESIQRAGSDLPSEYGDMARRYSSPLIIKAIENFLK